MYDEKRREFVPIDTNKIRGELEKFNCRTAGDPNSTLTPDPPVSEAEVIKRAGIAAGIAPEDQGPVFVKGEVIELRGVFLVVRGIGNKEITFRVAPKQKVDLGL